MRSMSTLMMMTIHKGMELSIMGITYTRCIPC